LEPLNPEKGLDCGLAVVVAVAVVASQSVCEDWIQYIHNTYRYYTNNRLGLRNERDP
jgi:hypothetical protein